MATVLDELLLHDAVDSEGVALGVVPADLAVRTAEKAVVAHPVGQVVGEPRAALGAVVVGAGGADQGGELRLPVHALRAVRDAEAVLDPQARVAVHLLPRELVSA